MASKRRNWILRKARKSQLVPAIGKNGGFPAYWMHDAKHGNRSALDKARGRYDYGFEAEYAFCRFCGFVGDI